MAQYFVKKDSIVKLTVTVSTMGEASTVAFKKVGSLKPVTVAETPDENGADGRIETTEIGSGDDLSHASIDVDTIVELGDIVDSSLWDSAFENIRITYIVEGGIEGKRIFGIQDAKKSRSQTKKTISLELILNITLLNIVA